jgi:hypothetical protein
MIPPLAAHQAPLSSPQPPVAPPLLAVGPAAARPIASPLRVRLLPYSSAASSSASTVSSSAPGGGSGPSSSPSPAPHNLSQQLIQQQIQLRAAQQELDRRQRELDAAAAALFGAPSAVAAPSPSLAPAPPASEASSLPASVLSSPASSRPPSMRLPRGSPTSSSFGAGHLPHSALSPVYGHSHASLPLYSPQVAALHPAHVFASLDLPVSGSRLLEVALVPVGDGEDKERSSRPGSAMAPLPPPAQPTLAPILAPKQAQKLPRSALSPTYGHGHAALPLHDPNGPSTRAANGDENDDDASHLDVRLVPFHERIGLPPAELPGLQRGTSVESSDSAVPSDARLLTSPVPAAVPAPVPGRSTASNGGEILAQNVPPTAAAAEVAGQQTQQAVSMSALMDRLGQISEALEVIRGVAAPSATVPSPGKKQQQQRTLRAGTGAETGSLASLSPTAASDRRGSPAHFVSRAESAAAQSSSPGSSGEGPNTPLPTSRSEGDGGFDGDSRAPTPLAAPSASRGVPSPQRHRPGTATGGYSKVVPPVARSATPSSSSKDSARATAAGASLMGSGPEALLRSPQAVPIQVSSVASSAPAQPSASALSTTAWQLGVSGSAADAVVTQLQYELHNELLALLGSEEEMEKLLEQAKQAQAGKGK